MPSRQSGNILPIVILLVLIAGLAVATKLVDIQQIFSSRASQATKQINFNGDGFYYRNGQLVTPSQTVNIILSSPFGGSVNLKATSQREMVAPPSGLYETQQSNAFGFASLDKTLLIWNYFGSQKVDNFQIRVADLTQNPNITKAVLTQNDDCTGSFPQGVICRSADPVMNRAQGNTIGTEKITDTYMMDIPVIHGHKYLWAIWSHTAQEDSDPVYLEFQIMKDPPQAYAPIQKSEYNLQASCVTDNQVKLSWNAFPRTDSYKLRLNNVAQNGWSGDCQAPDSCPEVEGNSTSQTFDVQPGELYDAWMHTSTGGFETVASEHVGFVCGSKQARTEGFRFVESIFGDTLSSVGFQSYPRDPYMFSHTFSSNQPGYKTFWVQFIDNTGKVSAPQSAIIEYDPEGTPVPSASPSDKGSYNPGPTYIAPKMNPCMDRIGTTCANDQGVSIRGAKCQTYMSRPDLDNWCTNPYPYCYTDCR